MLSPLRKIRWKLAADNNFKKYLRYAIGEIVLVVIGILIAMQINDWNSNRKQDKESVLLVKRILIETKENALNLNDEINRVNSFINEAALFLTMFGPDYHQMDSNMVDSLLYGLLTTPGYEHHSATLDEALNTGQVSIINSDSIRELLYSIPLLMIRIRSSEEELNRDIENNLIPYLYQRISFRQMDSKFSNSPYEIEESNLEHHDNRVTLTMRNFENMVDNKLFLLESLLLKYNDLKETFQILVKLLEDENNKNGVRHLS